MIRSKTVLSLAAGLAIVYAALSVAAVACLPAHAGESAPVHHQANATAHSLFCAFACQATQAVALASPSPGDAWLALVGPCLFTPAALFAWMSRGIRPSRAPPC